ncbi:uncharacterized protein PAC_15020 [Phialocephala subalpina]|uniref:Uncharacterized protein n=1 Tax=Phialocephala subalpina TaxID=576137 RepID=A0A1L7XJ92_9HELO|nr:uncharacterized protein PAC_15020 [Phialocephala subalpina]
MDTTMEAPAAPDDSMSLAMVQAAEHLAPKENLEDHAYDPSYPLAQLATNSSISKADSVSSMLQPSIHTGKNTVLTAAPILINLSPSNSNEITKSDENFSEPDPKPSHSNLALEMLSHNATSNSIISNEEDARHEVLRLSKMFNLNVQMSEVVAPMILQLPPAPARTGPLNLLAIPWDIRHIIIKFLLSNESLAKPTSVYEEKKFGAQQAYGLSPALLRVCHQLYEEGCNVLYEQQEFYIASLPWMGRHISPLTRYAADIHETPLREHDAVQKVKNWNVVISGYKAQGIRDPLPFLDLCRALHNLVPEGIKVGVMLKGMESEAVNNEDYEDIAIVLQPLKLLRNLAPGALKIEDVEIFTVPDNINLFDSAGEYISILGELPAQEVTDLMETVESNKAVELNFKMYDVLLKYCQTYELDHNFQAAMELPLGESLSEDVLGCEYENYYQFGNPYKGDIWHPVENGLRVAREAALLHNDTHAFKDERAHVLMYLEKQYQSICNASTNLVQFINEEKSMYYGLLDVDNIHERGVFPSHDSCHTALLLVKDYAKSFERESPLLSRVQISRNRWFKTLYLNTLRASLMHRLEEIFDLEDYSNVATVFRKLVDELDEQLIKIRLARKELFLWDVDKENLGVDMHPADPVCVEHINWYVREPEMGPEFGENPDPEDAAGSDGDDHGHDDDGATYSGNDDDGEAGEASEEDDASENNFVDFSGNGSDSDSNVDTGGHEEAEVVGEEEAGSEQEATDVKVAEEHGDEQGHGESSEGHFQDEQVLLADPNHTLAENDDTEDTSNDLDAGNVVVFVTDDPDTVMLGMGDEGAIGVNILDPEE